MKEQLVKYVDLLFAGAPDAVEIKQEILQNTLERYDDLLAHGKSPQAAYQLAISGIGDINEILCSEPTSKTAFTSQNTKIASPSGKPMWKKVLQAIAICLYIMCPVPLFVLQNELGLCGLLAIVAVATALMVISGGKGDPNESEEAKAHTKESQLKKAVNAIVWAIGLCVYFLISFTTQAWYITWVIFPLTGAVQGLVIACIDLKEATKHES